MSCEFCENFDFGIARCYMDSSGVRIYVMRGQFSEDEQFKFCPMCGESRSNTNSVQTQVIHGSCEWLEKDRKNENSDQYYCGITGYECSQCTPSP